ncbi:hypothetical protein CATYP_02935 [Corynebacterium atypicum]|uniref:Uncharacterized protein n=1 Tax=Corynebacterium atypicum TaxID=191610 RepID=A0ABM5QM47_9CORY|nr:hypothetical protein CATYP_02935 [Corynebacterium atypicum]
MVGVLLSVTFCCGLLIAAAHVFNRRFIAPIYDVVLNFIAFSAATASSTLLGEYIPAFFSGCAVVAWIYLGFLTYRALKRHVPLSGQSNY